MTSEPSFRKATRADLPEILRMLVDDKLGREREDFADPLPRVYYDAFEKVDSSPDNELIVAELDGRVAGSMQLTWIPSITFRGGMRLLVEAVRVDSPLRGRGVGEAMFRWAIERARERGCVMVQLTTNLRRPDALRFYERLGFVNSHSGLKLYLQ